MIFFINNYCRRDNEALILDIAYIKFSLDAAYEILMVLAEPKASPVTNETLPCSKINKAKSEGLLMVVPLYDFPK